MEPMEGKMRRVFDNKAQIEQNLMAVIKADVQAHQQAWGTAGAVISPFQRGDVGCRTYFDVLFL
jgi:hypothetical protein